MFETLNDVPEPIRKYYREDVVSEPTGEMIDEPYTYFDEEGVEQSGTRPVPEYHDVTYIILIGFGEIQTNVPTVLKLFKPLDVVNKFLSFENNGIDKVFHDTYLTWFTSEPIQDDYTMLTEEGETVHDLDSFSNAYQAWQSKYPTGPVYKVLTDYPEYEKYLKLLGVEFEGVMCSATKEDMWGLNSVHAFVKAGNDIDFEFDNGSVLKLTADNVEDFYAVWSPFRASFFS
ncbi:putative DUF4376 domain-containing protein [Vibrio phage 393E50-1]|nr:putative DUF4376 domain-containing protein [Vibrio phage 393E50-1]